jgi:cyanide hydratase
LTAYIRQTNVPKIDLDEIHLTKSLADFGGHYMRPDLIRLLVDTNRKDLVVHEDRVNGGVVYSKTIDRVGLSTPLDAAAPEAPLESK